MKKQLILAAILFAVAGTARAQQHAPSIEVCRADKALWLSDAKKSPTSIANLSFAEIVARWKEMLNCPDVDPERNSEYFAMRSFYGELMSDRLQDFLTRHNLWGKFQAEDAAGQR